MGVLERLASVWTWTVLVLVILAWLPLMALVRLVTWPFDRDNYVTGRLFRWIGIVTVTANPLWRFRAQGERVADPRHPYVVVANHESFADILLLCFLPWEMKWLGKEELFRIPVLGWLMRLASDIPVRRGQARSAVEAMRACRARLERRMSVVIFPEGTRSPTDELLPFKDGAFRLAIEAQVPILPVAIAGSRHALAARSLRMQRARAVAHVLPAIPTTGLTTRDVPVLRDRVRAAIAAKRAELLAPS